MSVQHPPQMFAEKQGLVQPGVPVCCVPHTPVQAWRNQNSSAVSAQHHQAVHAEAANAVTASFQLPSPYRPCACRSIYVSTDSDGNWLGWRCKKRKTEARCPGSHQPWMLLEARGRSPSHGRGWEDGRTTCLAIAIWTAWESSSNQSCTSSQAWLRTVCSPADDHEPCCGDSLAVGKEVLLILPSMLALLGSFAKPRTNISEAEALILNSYWLYIIHHSFVFSSWFTVAGVGLAPGQEQHQNLQFYMAGGSAVFVTFFKIAEEYKVPCPLQTFSTCGDMRGPQALWYC